MLVVQVTETGEEAAEFRCQAIACSGVQPIRFFDRQRVFGRERDDQVAEELVVDVGGNREFGLAQTQAALAGRDVAAGHESAERVLVRILRKIAVRALQHGGNGRVEGADARCGRRRRRSRDGWRRRGLRRNRGGRRRCRRGCVFRLRVLEPLLQRLDTCFVAFFQLPDLFANLREIGVGRCQCWRRCKQRQRQRAKRQNESGHHGAPRVTS